MKYQYSFSRLRNYAVCPRYFKCKHIDKIPEKEGAPLKIGSVLHDMLAEYSTACYKAGETHLYDEWEKIARKVLRVEPLLPEFEDEIMVVFKEYVESNEIELEGLAGIEERVAFSEDFESVSWEDGWFRMIMDKLYIAGDQCKISDYKTGHNFTPDKFQLEVYVWGASKLYPQLRYFEVEWDLVRFSHKPSWNIEFGDLKAIEAKIMNRIAQIEEDSEFEPCVGSYCAECGYYTKCPAIIEQGQIERAPDTPESAQELLSEIISREKGVKELKGLLKAYAEKAGTVCANDMKAEFKGQISLKWDLTALLEWANKNGKDLMDALNVDGNKIKKFKVPDKFSKATITTKFQIIKDSKK